MNGNSWEWFGVSRDNENVCSLDHGALAETGWIVSSLPIIWWSSRELFMGYRVIYGIGFT